MSLCRSICFVHIFCAQLTYCAAFFGCCKKCLKEEVRLNRGLILEHGFVPQNSNFGGYGLEVSDFRVRCSGYEN